MYGHEAAFLNSFKIMNIFVDQLSGAIYITSMSTYGAPTPQPTTIGDVLIQKVTLNKYPSAY